MSEQTSSTQNEKRNDHRSTGLRELFGDRAFALHFIGQTASAGGGALSSIALAFGVLSISDSPSALGLVLLASRLPAIALTLTGGVMADRWSRKRIAVYADSVRTVVQLLTGALLLSGHATVLIVVLLAAITGGATAIFGPAATALVAGVTPDGQVRRANSVLGIGASTMQTGGLALSGLIVGIAGPGASFLIDGATFAVSAITLALMPYSSVPTPASRRPLLRDLGAGWRLVISHRWLVIYAAHQTIINVLALCPFFVLGPVIAKDRFGGAPAWSLIALGYVIGNLGAAHLTYHWAPRRPVFAAIALSAGLAPMLALLGLGAPLWLIVPAAILAGAQATLYSTLLTTTLQANLPSETLGRAAAITGLASTILVPLGMGVAGILAGLLSASTILIAASVLVVGVATAFALLPAARRALKLDIDGNS